MLRNITRLISLKTSALAWLTVFSISLTFAADQNNQTKLVTHDGSAEDLFGFSVAIFGDTALVGSIRSDSNKLGEDSGSAYVYTLGEKGWSLQAKLMANDGQPYDTVGGNVALAENIAVLGAIGHDEKGDNAGAAYVFTRKDGTWTQQAKLTAQDTRAGDAFGQSIAVSQNTIVIGAPHTSDKGKSAGSAYVFRKDGSKWVEEAKLSADDVAPGDVFGISVAHSGDTIIVGADLHDAKANNAGAVYIYVKNKNGWEQQAKLMADDAADTDLFGVRVALSGDTALISARRDDDELMGVDAGSAYVFQRKGNRWYQQAKLKAPDGAADDRFARSVAIEGNIAVLGAMHRDDKGENAGAAYVFLREGNTWQAHDKLLANDAKAKDLLGFSISMSQGNVVVGSPRNDEREEDSGSAYIFELR